MEKIKSGEAEEWKRGKTMGGGVREKAGSPNPMENSPQDMKKILPNTSARDLFQPGSATQGDAAQRLNAFLSTPSESNVFLNKPLGDVNQSKGTLPTLLNDKLSSNIPTTTATAKSKADQLIEIRNVTTGENTSVHANEKQANNLLAILKSMQNVTVTH